MGWLAGHPKTRKITQLCHHIKGFHDLSLMAKDKGCFKRGSNCEHPPLFTSVELQSNNILRTTWDKYVHIIHQKTCEIMAIFLRKIIPKEYCHYTQSLKEIMFLSLGDLNIYRDYFLQWLPQNMGFYSALQCHSAWI